VRHECRENSSNAFPLHLLLPPGSLASTHTLFPIFHLLASKRPTFNVYYSSILSSRSLAVRYCRSIFLPHSPTFDSNNDNDPRHQERDHAHRDRENEHSVQAIGFHCLDAVASLTLVSQ
jgi:hypothetical protein